MTGKGKELRSGKGHASSGSGQLVGDDTSEAVFAAALRSIMTETGELPVLVLDKDGTITNPRQPLGRDVAEAILSVLAEGSAVAVISGAEMYRLESEVFHALKQASTDPQVLSNLFLIPENGTQMYRFNPSDDAFQLVYRVDLRRTIGEARLNTLLTTIDETMDRYGIERRPERKQIVADGSQIKFSPLGNIHDDELRASFDPAGERRAVWAQHIRDQMISQGMTDDEGLIVDIIVAGTASINVLPRAVNKGFAVDRLATLLGLKNHSVVYFGDKLAKDGNDAAVITRARAVVNVGEGMETEPSSSVVVTSREKGPSGTRVFLGVASEVFREFNTGRKRA